MWFAGRLVSFESCEGFPAAFRLGRCLFSPYPPLSYLDPPRFPFLPVLNYILLSRFLRLFMILEAFNRRARTLPCCGPPPLVFPQLLSEVNGVRHLFCSGMLGRLCFFSFRVLTLRVSVVKDNPGPVTIALFSALSLLGFLSSMLVKDPRIPYVSFLFGTSLTDRGWASFFALFSPSQFSPKSIGWLFHLAGRSSCVFFRLLRRPFSFACSQYLVH